MVDDNDNLGNEEVVEVVLFVVFMNVGDYVWEDLNDDGIQDFDEFGLEGVIVILYECVGGVKGDVIISIMIDEEGFYLFFGLVLDVEYCVEFDVIIFNYFDVDQLVWFLQDVGNGINDLSVDFDDLNNVGCLDSYMLVVSEIYEGFDVGVSV